VVRGEETGRSGAAASSERKGGKYNWMIVVDQEAARREVKQH